MSNTYGHDNSPSSRLVVCANWAPFAAWWVTLGLLVVLLSPLAVAWFASGLLMFTHRVFTIPEDDYDA
jgi:hypothetical protein